MGAAGCRRGRTMAAARERLSATRMAQVARARQRAPAGEHLDRVDQCRKYLPAPLCLCLPRDAWSHALSHWSLAPHVSLSL